MLALPKLPTVMGDVFSSEMPRPFHYSYRRYISLYRDLCSTKGEYIGNLIASVNTNIIQSLDHS